MNITFFFKREIYGYKVDLSKSISELCETYQASDKYLVFGFTKNLIESFEKVLDEENCLLMFEQLFKLKLENNFINKTKAVIEMKIGNALGYVNFKQIDEDTLICLLNFKQLNISEVEILKACKSWVCT